MDPNEIINEFNNSQKDLSSNLSIDDIQILKNYEKRNQKNIKKVSILKNTNALDNKKLEIWCEQHGLDYTEIQKLLKQYFNDHKVRIFIYEWVQKYNKYIPYFENLSKSSNILEFIFISSFVNYSIANIDDRTDYKVAIKDPNSLVTGNKIMGLLKEVDSKTKKVSITHLIRFDPIYIPAVVPSLVYYLENNLLIWDVKNYYYKNVTSDMLEKYLIPESGSKEEIRKTKIYNNTLLSILRLLRS
jgi:hypothetical protein